MSKFNIGDKVIIRDGTSQTIWEEEMKEYIGTIGEIEMIRDDEIRVRLELDDDYWFFWEEDLKLVKS